MTNAKYVIFNPRVNRPLHELSREEARVAYDWFISQIDSRVAMLRDWASNLGFVLMDEENAIGHLHDLLVSEVRKEGVRDVPSPYIFSLCNDIAIFISELLISNCPSLKWSFHTGRKNDISYQRPVITGFNVKNKNYSLDIDYIICAYAHRLSQGANQEPGLFREIYETAISQVEGGFTGC